MDKRSPITKIDDNGASADMAAGAFDTKLQKAINLLISIGWNLEHADAGYLLFRKYLRQHTHDVSLNIRPPKDTDDITHTF